MNRIGDWIQTRNRVRFYPLDPRPEEVLIEDIAFALAHTNRFNGHAGQYSVAEHSCRVAQVLLDEEVMGGNSELVLAGLLHDAAEAYVADLPRPLKVSFRQAGFRTYDHAEELVMNAVERRFGLPEGICSCPSVQRVDAILLATERRDLFPNALPWSALPKPLRRPIVPWSARIAERNFLRLFGQLTAEHTGGQTQLQQARDIQRKQA